MEKRFGGHLGVSENSGSKPFVLFFSALLQAHLKVIPKNQI